MYSTKNYSRFFISLSFFVSVFQTAPAIAEEQIVVTGSAQVTSMAELPASATVLSQDEITESGVSFLQNQILDIPNFNYSGGTSRPRFFQIRGIGDLEQYEGAPNSSVAVIVDDVDLTGIGAALTLFDIEQFEVFRGPQPTRFGSSALAGAINLRTAQATQEIEGMTLLSVGNDSLFSIGAAGGGALTDNLSLRLTAFGHQQDGFRDNEFFGVNDTNERDEFTGRAKLHFTPSDDVEFTLTLTNVDIDNGYDVFTIFNGFNTQSDRPGRDEERLKLATLQGKIKLSDTTQLRTTSSIYESEVDYSFDGDWGSNSFWAPFDPYDFFSDTDRRRKVFAQQVRLEGELPVKVGKNTGSYVVGGFFQSLDEATVTNEFSDDIVFDSLDSDYRADTYAAFANVELPLATDWAIHGGLRGEQRDTRYRDSRNSSFTPDDLLWGGSLTLEHTLAEDNIAYLLVSRGFRGGGFNASPSLEGDRREFSEESLVNIELGTRFSLLQGDLRGSVAAFYNKRSDQQVRLALQVDPADPLSFTFLTDNAASGQGAGFETEIDYQISESFALRTRGALLHTEVTSADPLLASLEGRDQAHAPNWQYSVMGEYYVTDQLSLMGGFSGRDAFFFDDSHDQKSGVYHLLNTSIRYSTEKWDLQLWGRNLTDKEYATRGFFFGNEPPEFTETQYVQLGDPRSFGFTWTYRFGESA